MRLFRLTPFSTRLFAFFFFNDTATTEIYTLSLHDALPIWSYPTSLSSDTDGSRVVKRYWPQDRKSTRLNSSHSQISYAVFCLKKKKYGVVWNLTFTQCQCFKQVSSKPGGAAPTTRITQRSS